MSVLYITFLSGTFYKCYILLKKLDTLNKQVPRYRENERERGGERTRDCERERKRGYKAIETVRTRVVCGWVGGEGGLA